MTELLDVLKQMYDHVVIDTPPAFTEHVLAAFDLSDHYVLLATLDIPALKNLRLTLDMLDLLGYPRETWLVVLNRSDSKVGLSISDVEQTLRTQISADPVAAARSRRSINKGVPLVVDEPNHPVSTAIRGHRQSCSRAARHAASRHRRSPAAATPARADASPAATRTGLTMGLAGPDRRRQVRRTQIVPTSADAGRRTSRARPASSPAPARTRSPRSRPACTRRCSTASAPSSTTRGWTRPSSSSRCALTAAVRCSSSRRPRCQPADRTQIAQEVADEILGHGPLEPFLRDPEVTEIMVNGPNQIFVERARPDLHAVHATFANDAHLRRTIDKIVGRVGRRVDEASPMVDARLPDGSRVNAVVAPDRARRRDAHHPQVRRATRSRVDDLVGFGTFTRAVRRPARGLRARPAQHAHLRRHRLGQDHHAQRGRGFIPDDERIVTDRGRRRAAAAPGARAAAGVPAAQHRGPGPDRHPRPGAQRAADAARPHRRRRGPRRRRARHAAGDEHRPRRLDHHGARQHPARPACPGWRRWC